MIYIDKDIIRAGIEDPMVPLVFIAIKSSMPLTISKDKYFYICPLMLEYMLFDKEKKGRTTKIRDAIDTIKNFYKYDIQQESKTIYKCNKQQFMDFNVGKSYFYVDFDMVKTILKSKSSQRLCLAAMYMNILTTFNYSINEMFNGPKYGVITTHPQYQLANFINVTKETFSNNVKKLVNLGVLCLVKRKPHKNDKGEWIQPPYILCRPEDRKYAIKYIQFISKKGDEFFE